jgi:hypothetical protein
VKKTFRAGVRVPSTSNSTSVSLIERSERGGKLWAMTVVIDENEALEGYVMVMSWQIPPRFSENAPGNSPAMCGGSAR